MKKSIMLPLYALLLITTLVILFIIKSEKDVLQKNIDLIFTNAITDSMNGLSKGYNEIDNNQKIQYYYQIITNLKDALDVFHVSSYKEYDDFFQTLNRLYIYLLENHNATYEIDRQLYIFEFLGKIMVYPDDNQLISDFNSYLDEIHR